METGADPGAGGSALSEELRQQIFQFVTENLPMLEDIIRQAKEREGAGGAQTSKAKRKEKKSPPDPSEDESRDRPPRRKRPRTPPRPWAGGRRQREILPRPDRGEQPKRPFPKKTYAERVRAFSRSICLKPAA